MASRKSRFWSEYASSRAQPTNSVNGKSASEAVARLLALRKDVRSAVWEISKNMDTRDTKEQMSIVIHLLQDIVGWFVHLDFPRDEGSSAHE
jgi:hypothetical protein